ncbi:NAD-dependent epimerase/dehydratase family protein [Azospirillum halopraeferens]|uniref:NAD-dependent epimerase/dehydratase family protein n=1 Tax=Azospirillum halopraeferens TaxID=34010 RepID=UPI0004016E3F|nr:NAD-dependent epimerase/dehydratase family protein [Azospirillum halopraeferens]
MADRHVVLGAGRSAGLALVAELAGRGLPVRAVTRDGRALPGVAGEAAVERVAADVADPEAARRACAGAAVVYACAGVPYPQWEEMLPRLVEGALAGAAAARARLVFFDNLYMYGPPAGPMTEETPRRPQGPKGHLRARLEEVLLDAHARGRVPVAIGRAGDLYGPAANSVTGPLVFEPVVEGRTARWPGSLDAPHTLTFVEDAARGLAQLGIQDMAYGAIWHLPSGPPVTGREFIRAVCAEAATSVRVSVLRGWMLALAGLVNPMAREMRELLYQFEAPFVMDSAKFERTFGGRVTPLSEGIRRTLDWYRARD